MREVAAKHIRDAGDRAEQFRQMGFHCSEAVLRGTAAALNLTLDFSLLRASTGFRGGGGGHGDRCGALEAGAMLIGLIFGRTEPEEDNACASQLVLSLHERFERELGSTACRLLRPMAHLHWSDNFSCGPVYRKGAELAAETILTAHERCLICPPFDIAHGRAERIPADKEALREILARIRALAERNRLMVTEAARSAQARLGIEEEDIAFSLCTATLVHLVWGGKFVVEGRKRDRWYLTTVVRLHPDNEDLEVLAIL